MYLLKKKVRMRPFFWRLRHFVIFFFFIIIVLLKIKYTIQCNCKIEIMLDTKVKMVLFFIINNASSIKTYYVVVM